MSIVITVCREWVGSVTRSKRNNSKFDHQHIFRLSSPPLHPTPMSSAFPPQLSDAESHALLDAALDWAQANGLVMRSPGSGSPPASSTPSTFSVVHAPFALFPSLFPAEQYRRVVEIQPIWNRLVHAISKDDEFLTAIMEDLAKHDEFTGRIYDIYKQAKKDPKLHVSFLEELSGPVMVTISEGGDRTFHFDSGSFVDRGLSPCRLRL